MIIIIIRAKKFMLVTSDRATSLELGDSMVIIQFLEINLIIGFLWIVGEIQQKIHTTIYNACSIVV